ncbi:hypothetical protein HBO10_19900 [Pseudomonas sp. WS 5503]|uniref:hypothetical protein n=1 Tax=Pseudomonas TaxID=286 RepID=UPI00110CDD56|nr:MULTISPECIES: hypothetical protein [unclassified Pseudomonas]MBV4512723.1 hypothetical protein [Pseudomonas sp. SWRI22]NMX81797.1 hypothetical protein [Pseudomonas sp. WS 5503]
MQKLMMVVPFFLLLAACGQSEADKARSKAEMAEIRSQRVAREFVSGVLKDPESAEFRNQKGFCGEVNSKNSFGGYAGFKRFIAASEEMVVFAGDDRMTSTDFEQAWSQFCR